MYFAHTVTSPMVREGLLCSASQAFDQRGIFIMPGHTCRDTGPRFLRSRPKGHPNAPCIIQRID